MKHKRFSVRIDSRILADITKIAMRIGYSKNATISMLLRESIARSDKIISDVFGIQKK